MSNDNREKLNPAFDQEWARKTMEDFAKCKEDPEYFKQHFLRVWDVWPVIVDEFGNKNFPSNIREFDMGNGYKYFAKEFNQFNNQNKNTMENSLVTPSAKREQPPVEVQQKEILEELNMIRNNIIKMKRVVRTKVCPLTSSKIFDEDIIEKPGEPNFPVLNMIDFNDTVNVAINEIRKEITMIRETFELL